MPSRIFSETVSIIGVNPFVRPPDDVLHAIFEQSGKQNSPIPVRGKLNGAPFRQSLVRYQGDWRLYINIAMAKAAGMSFSRSVRDIVGTRVAIEIESDPEPPVYAMIPSLQRLLDRSPVAKHNWNKLIPSRRKEILRYISRLKSHEAKERNLQKVIEVLSGKEKRFMARSWKDGT
jgi:hypothetical protein